MQRVKFAQKVFSAAIIFVFLLNTALYDTHYLVERNLPAKNHLRPQHTYPEEIRKALQGAHVRQRAQELCDIIRELSTLGIKPKVNDRLLSGITDPMELYYWLQRFCVVKDLCDLKIILKARANIERGEQVPEEIDKDTAFLLYNSLFEQQRLMSKDKPLKMVLFRGGRGASDFTKYIRETYPDAQLIEMLGATDDGRSWFMAAQDFNATGIPDCGKALLDLAADKKVAAFLGLRMKGDKEDLAKAFDYLVTKLSNIPYAGAYDAEYQRISRLAEPMMKRFSEIKDPDKQSKLLSYLQAFQKTYKDKSSRFTFDDIPMRSIVIVGAAWKLGKADSPSWQQAADAIGEILEIGNNRVMFPTLKRQHLVGLEADGTIYFTETGINENPKRSGLVATWLMDEMPDINKFIAEINRFIKEHNLGPSDGSTISFTSKPIKVGALTAEARFLKGRDINDKPIDEGLVKEITDTTKRIANCQPWKVKAVAEYFSSISTTANPKAAQLDLPVGLRKIIEEEADIIIFCPSTLDSNIGSAIMVPGVRKAIRNSKAIKLNFVNSTIEADKVGTTAMSMIRRIFGYLSGQQPFETERVDWTETTQYLDYAIGKAMQYPARDSAKTYIPFDAMEVRTATGGEVRTVTLDLEDPTPKMQEDKNYVAGREQFGFYAPSLMTETVLALHGVRQCGYEITFDGRLLLGGAADRIINKDKAREVAVMLVDKYPAKQLPYLLESISNRLISRFVLNPRTEVYIRQFYAALVKRALSLQDADAAAAVQVMAKQTLNIITLIKFKVPGARDMMVTADETKMLVGDKGKSYLNALTLPVPIAKNADKPGFYFRGIEGVPKLGEGVISDRDFGQCTQYDSAKFDIATQHLLLYVMNHGFLPVPEELQAATETGEISTIHHTAFIHDVIPGSILCTSTGKGHYQRDKLDIKQWVAGRMLQFNVKYDEKGNIREVLVQPFDEQHPWAVALPGYVDYMVSLEGQPEFFDFSIQAKSEDLQKINPEYDEAAQAKIEDAIKKAKFAPYSVLSTGGRHYMLKTVDEGFEATWINGPSDIMNQVAGDQALPAYYRNLISHGLYALTENISTGIGEITQPLEGADKARLPPITKDQARKRISDIKDVIARVANEPIVTAPATKLYLWGGQGNRVALGLPEDLEHPIAEVWLDSTQNDGLSVISETQIDDIAPITLKELVRYHPEALGGHLGSKDFFVKFLCTNFPPQCYEGFDLGIRGITLNGFVEFVQKERRLLHDLLNMLSIDNPGKLEAFKKTYTDWCNYQASSGWRDTTSNKTLPYLGQYVNEDSSAQVNQLLAEIRDNRREITSTLNLIQFTPGIAILSPADRPHGILGLSLQTHPKLGPDAKYEAWIPIVVRGKDGTNHTILIEVQQNSNVTNSIADFYTPFDWDKKAGKVVMRKKLAKRPVTSQEDLVNAECEAIKTTILEGLSGKPTEVDDFIVRPRIISGGTANDSVTVESVIEGAYGDIWPTPFFTVHSVTFDKEASYQAKPLDDNYHTIVVVSGKVKIRMQNGAETVLSMGEKDVPKSCFMGAEMKQSYEIIADDKAQVLVFSQRLPEALEAVRPQAVPAAEEVESDPGSLRATTIEAVYRNLSAPGYPEGISLDQVIYLEGAHNHPHSLQDIPFERKVNRLTEQHACLIEMAMSYIAKLKQDPDAEQADMFMQRPYPDTMDDTTNPENVIEIAVIGRYDNQDNATMELAGLFRAAGWEPGDKVWSAEVDRVAGESLPAQAADAKKPIMVVFELKTRNGQRTYGTILDSVVDQFAAERVAEGTRVFYKNTDRATGVVSIMTFEEMQQGLSRVLRKYRNLLSALLEAA